MFTETQNIALTRTELDVVFFDAYDQDPMPGIAHADTTSIFKPMNTNKSGEFYELFKSVGMFEETDEAENYSTYTPGTGSKILISVVKFTQSVFITEEMQEDDQHGVVNEMVADLGRKARMTQDKNAFGLFNGAFTTTTTGLGTAAIGTQTVLSGDTYSNIVTGPLSDSSFNDAIIALSEQLDETGTLNPDVPKVLLVPSTLFKTARQIVGSELVSDTNNNAINVYKSAYGVMVFTSPWLNASAGGSDTAWFLLGSSHKVFRLVRKSVSTDYREPKYSDNGTAKYIASFREQYFIAAPQGIVGSLGTV